MLTDNGFKSIERMFSAIKENVLKPYHTPRSLYLALSLTHSPNNKIEQGNHIVVRTRMHHYTLKHTLCLCQAEGLVFLFLFIVCVSAMGQRPLHVPFRFHAIAVAVVDFIRCTTSPMALPQRHLDIIFFLIEAILRSLSHSAMAWHIPLAAWLRLTVFFFDRCWRENLHMIYRFIED